MVFCSYLYLLFFPVLFHSHDYYSITLFIIVGAETPIPSVPPTVLCTLSLPHILVTSVAESDGIVTGLVGNGLHR